MSAEVVVKQIGYWTYYLPPKMTQPTSFSILPVTEGDKNRVLFFLRTSFFPDEPMVDYLGFMRSPDSQNTELEEHSVESIPEGTSIMAVNGDGRILGVCLNTLLTRDQHSLEPPESEQQLELEKCPDPRFRKILKLLKLVYWKSQPFKSYPDVNSVLEIKIIAVDASSRGQGVAKALIKRTIDMARERSVPLLRVDCTSAFSAQAVERVGFRKVLSLPFADYRDPEGNPILTPKLPHTAVNSFVYFVEKSDH